jgi:hypothetical protein
MGIPPLPTRQTSDGLEAWRHEHTPRRRVKVSGPQILIHVLAALVFWRTIMTSLQRVLLRGSTLVQLSTFIYSCLQM